MNILLMSVASTFILLLTFAAYIKKIVTREGAMATALFGLIINFTGGFIYILILMLFITVAYIATMYQFSLKKAIGIQEGSGGERGWQSVTSHVLVPTILIVMYYTLHAISTPLFEILILSAFAFAISDAVASEMGVISNKTYSIITWKKVDTGVNVGISLFGEVWALLGSLFITLSGSIIMNISGMTLYTWYYPVILSSVSGFIGCNIDSILGDLVENRGFISKFSNNFLSMIASIFIAYGAYIIMMR